MQFTAYTATMFIKKFNTKQVNESIGSRLFGLDGTQPLAKTSKLVVFDKKLSKL